jgi:hypothetical protein
MSTAGSDIVIEVVLGRFGSIPTLNVVSLTTDEVGEITKIVQDPMT